MTVSVLFCLHTFCPMSCLEQHLPPTTLTMRTIIKTTQHPVIALTFLITRTQDMCHECPMLAAGDFGGGHPTCFLHWDKQINASHSVERGELCLCLMSMHLWQEEAHHTDFLWHQRVTWSLISVPFHPNHKSLPPLWMQRPSAAPPKGWVVLFTTLASPVRDDALVTLLLLIKYSVWKHVCFSVNVFSEEHVILWSLTDRLRPWWVWFPLLIADRLAKINKFLQLDKIFIFFIRFKSGVLKR